jgi:hypothetical protein|tara:strand:+ start:210 stop:413 length:204 start_codon:yes stop_codon:yes gene_type:complete
MKRPSYPYRLLIILLILTVIPIGTTHIASMYLGPKNGILLGFCVGIPCVTFACWKMFMDGWRDEDEE